MAGTYLDDAASVDVKVEGRGASFSGVISVGTFHRALDGDDCPALVRALLLSASLARVGPPEEPAPAPEAARAASAPVSPKPTLWLGLEAGARSLVGPPVAAHASLSVGLGLAGAMTPQARLAVLRTLMTSIVRSSGRTDTVLTAARVEGCPVELPFRLAGARSAIAPCAAVELGVLEAGVHGPAARPAAARPWMTLGVGLRPAVAVSADVAIEANLQGFVPLTHERFVTASETYVAASPGGSAALGIRGRFW